MNIFLLDYDPEKCAQYHCDKHVVKMIVEYAQLLSTSLRLYGYDAGYQITHQNHPSAIWTRECQANWTYLRHLALCVCREYSFRYNKEHKTQSIIERLPFPSKIPGGTLCLQAIPQCMPDAYKHSDPVVAYRNYYMGEKARILKWKVRGEPQWIDTLTR